MDPKRFIVIAGHEVVAAREARRDREVGRTAEGYRPSETLVQAQMSEAASGIRGVELVKSAYGWSVRYDSNLQDRAILAGSRDGRLDGTLDAAMKFAFEWQQKDPTRRYAWFRRSEITGVV